MQVPKLITELEIMLNKHKVNPTIITYQDICEYIIKIEEEAEELIIEYKEQSDDNL